MGASARSGDFPWYLFATQDGRQTASRFAVHPADAVNSLHREREVRYRSLGTQTSFSAATRELLRRARGLRRESSIAASSPSRPTTSIKLGIDPPGPVERLGRCFKLYKARGSTETFLYGVVRRQASELPILKLANMPFVLRLEYQFERGKLVRYRFGYDYP